jgi:dienelactone hydrolase
MTRGRLIGATLAIAILGGALFAARPYFRGLAFVVRTVDMHGTIRRLADSDAVATSERDLQIPIAADSIRARTYEPQRRARRTVLLVSGLHPSGIEEPRLVGLARQLAASGIAVVTPDIPDLRQFTITPTVTDQIERSASWLASQPEFASDGRIGLMGISFSGGLAIVAAGRASLRDHLAFVFSLGGHDDLPRVLKYLCTGVETPPPESTSPLTGLMQQRDAAKTPGTAASVATGWAPPPHDYGAAIVLLNLADRVVPAAQVESLRAAIRRFLQASAWDRDEKAKAEAEFTALRSLPRTMREPSATLLRYVNDRDVVHLGARLVTSISSYGNAPALSPARSPKPSAPVFLLHGTEDNVIPAVETLHLAATLRGAAPTRMLLSGLISHAEADRPATARDVMALASFWGDLIGR